MPRLITREDIKTWVSRYDSKANILILISRLVRAIAERDTYIEFPSGSAIFLPGWDAKTHAESGNEYIPKGTALWEIGTEQGYKAKADGDYEKRTLNPLGFNTTEATFIFVTPHDWNDKDTWISARKAEGKWRDVKVYDVKDIEQWLDLAPAVEKWFSVVLKKAQADGLLSCEDFWQEWSTWYSIKLQPELVTCGREVEMRLLMDFLRGEVGIKAIKAASKDEAISFAIATILQMDSGEQESLLARGLIVEREDVFRTMSGNFANVKSLALISRFKNAQGLYRGVTDGHHVIYPMGGDDTFPNDILELPPLGRDANLALEKSGIEQDAARDYLVKSGRDLSALKRLLGFPQSKADWAQANHSETLIPALLISRWEESVAGDIELLTELLPESFEEAHKFFFQLTKSETPFLYNFGTSWRLASPFDAWFNLAPYLKPKDFARLGQIAERVLSETNPAFDLEPSKREMAGLYGKRWKYSGWLREGIVQSIVLVAVYGDKFHMNHGFPTSQLWADTLVNKLLATATNKSWMSLDQLMPLIAEGSPSSFLTNLTRFLNSENAGEIFAEDPSTITPRTYYTGLLWSLEGIAWLPEHLSHASHLLAKLADVDPGGRLSNRPINSLREIYLMWHPQTFATLDERLLSLSELCTSTPEVAWDLLLRLLPKGRDIGHGTHKLSWRLFGFAKPVTNLSQDDWDKQVSFFVEKLLSLTNYDEDKIANLLDASLSLNESYRSTVIQFIEENVSKLANKSHAIWHHIRTIIPRYKQVEGKDWALNVSELKSLEALYNLLTPNDIAERTMWMFEDRWPQFVDIVVDHTKISHEEHWALIDGKKQAAVNELFSALGLPATINLINSVKDKWAFGYSLASSVQSKEAINQVLTERNLSSDDTKLAMQAFVFRKFVENGFEWLQELVTEADNKGFSSLSIANILLQIPFGEKLFELLKLQRQDIQSEYWKNAKQSTYGLSVSEKLFIIERLQSVDRNITALDVAHEAISDIPTELVLNLLETALKVQNSEERKLDQYHIQRIFKEVSDRDDVDKTHLARLQWMYLPLLVSYSGSTAHISLLNEELAKSPTFFLEIIKLLYRPQTPHVDESQLSSDELQHKQFMAENAYKLMSAWNFVPGTLADGSIDRGQLWQWVNEVRILGQEADRIRVVDMHIGQVFAKSPERVDAIWPPDPICEVIDTLNSDSLNRNFQAAVFNKQGSYSKGVFEGGNRERNLSNYYNNFAKTIAQKWPITSSILKSLADGYLHDAQREDDEAAKESLDN